MRRRLQEQKTAEEYVSTTASEDHLLDAQSEDEAAEDAAIRASCCSKVSRWMQNSSYQLMAYTIWDRVITGFKPARLRAMALLEIQETDRLLFVGEGSGMDFECLPEITDKQQLQAFDFSAAMVEQSRVKAVQHGIPEENCFVGDAQSLPFTEEKFDKIFFPLSLASIPNPTLAFEEAERVLAVGGKIVLLEKLVDDEETISRSRYALNFFTSATFADITRNLTDMMGDESPLKITHYESVGDQLEGAAYYLGSHYRIAVLVRDSDFPEQPALAATL